MYLIVTFLKSSRGIAISPVGETRDRDNEKIQMRRHIARCPKDFLDIEKKLMNGFGHNSDIPR